MLSKPLRAKARQLGKHLANEKLCILAGAGISRAAPANLPDWIRLVNALDERLKTRVAAETLRQPLQAMSIIEARLGRGEQARRKLGREIRRILPSSAKPTQVHRLLVRMRCPVFTTNVDDLFEQADRMEGTNRWFIRADRDLASRESGQRLFKLHGDLGDPTTCVLAERDYMDVMNGARFRGLFDKFRSALLSSFLLLLGHSLSDPDLKWALNYVHHVLGVRARKPLLLTRRPTRNERTLAESRGIALIELGDFSEILPFLNQILLSSSKRETKAVRVQPAVAGTQPAVEVIHEAWEEEARRIDDLLKGRNYQAAQTAAEEWESRISRVQGVSPAVRSRIHRIKAICLRDSNQLQKAEAEIDAALAAEPASMKNRVHKAVIAYMTSGRHRAREALRGVRGLEAKRVRAAISLESGDPSGVRRLMKAEDAQLDADCQVLFAQYCLRQGLHDGAIAAAQKAAEISNGSRVLEFAGDTCLTIGMEGVQQLVEDREVLIPDLSELPVDGLAKPGVIRQAISFYQRAVEALGNRDSDAGRLLRSKIGQCAQAIGDDHLYRGAVSEELLPACLRRLLAMKRKPSRRAGRACARELARSCHTDQERLQALLQAAHTLAANGYERAGLGVLDCAQRHLVADLRVFYHWLRGTCLVKSEGLPAAMSEIQKARTTPQGMPAVWLYKARLCAAADHAPSALRWFKKAHRAGQFRGSVLYYYSKFLVGVVRDYGKAAEVLAELIQILPTVNLKENFIQAALSSGSEEWQRRAFSEARALLENGQESRVVLSALMHCYRADRDWRRATETAEEYLAQWPDDSSVRNNYALFLSFSGQPDAALFELDRATKGAEAKSEVRFRGVVNRVQVLIDAERYPEALEAARGARDLFSDRAETWLALIDASELVGKEAEFTLAVAEFHRRFPEHPAVQVRRGTRPLVRLIKKWDAATSQARNAYLQRKIPIQLYANALRLPVSVVWVDLSRNGRITSGLYTPPNVAAEAKRIDDAKGLVLDYTALLGVDALDLWGQLAHLPQCRLSGSLVAQLRRDRHSVQGRLRPEHLAKCQAIMSCLGSNGNVHIREKLPRDQIPKAWQRKHGLLIAADLCEATAESGLVLDDIATGLPASLCLRTNQLLRSMRDRGWLSHSEFDRCIAELTACRSYVRSEAEAPLCADRRAISTPVVISQNGLDALYRLGVLQAVIHRCSKIVVSLPTSNHFVAEVAKLRFWEEARNSLDRLLRGVKQVATQAVTASELRDADLDGVGVPEALRANWFLARKEGWLLWSDDHFVRAATEVASQLKGPKTTTTVSFLSWLRGKGHIPEDDYHRAICKLVGLRYEYILLEADTLQWGMSEYNWHLTDSVSDVLSYFGRMFDVGRPAFPAIHHFFTCFDALLAGLWQQRHLTFAERTELSVWLCENTFPTKWTISSRPGLTANLVRFMLARVASLPLAAARPFAAWIGNYARRLGLPASRLSAILSDFANAEGEPGVTDRLSTQFFRDFLSRLPAFLRALVTPSSANARRLRSQARTRPVKALRVQTAAGSVYVHEDDLLIPAELEVARRGKKAIDRDGLVHISFKPARFAMPEKRAREWDWASFPDEMEARIGVRAVELLTATDPNVRQIIAERLVGKLAIAKSVLSCRADALRDGMIGREQLPRELLKLMSIPAVSLELRHGREINEDWLTEFVNMDPRALYGCYCARRDDGSWQELRRASVWPRLLHELPPRVGCFGGPAKKLAPSQRGKLTSALIGVVGSTYDPFALGAALEGLCQVSAQGKRLGPRQLSKVRKHLTSALSGFRHDRVRRERTRAFCQILRATSWAVREQSLGPAPRSADVPCERHILETIVPTTRDIARVLRLQSATESNAIRVAHDFADVARDLLTARSGDMRIPRLKDVADHRCAHYWALTHAIVSDVLAMHPAFLRRITDRDLGRWLVGFLSPGLLCFSLPRPSSNRLGAIPTREPARAARDALICLVRGSKRKQEILQHPLPTWNRAATAIRKAGPIQRDLAFRAARLRVPFMTKGAADRLFVAGGGAGQVWADVQRGSESPLEFAWVALGMLGRKSRRALIRATASGIIEALESKDRDSAILGCACFASRISQLTASEWEEMSEAAIEAIRTDVLPEVARRNTAHALLDLPARAGRLNRDLARKAAIDVFPDLAERP